MRNSAPILVLRPRRSPRLLAALVLMHALAGWALWQAALPLALAIVLSLSLPVSLALAWRRMLPVTALQWGEGPVWHVLANDGKARRALLDVQASRSLAWAVSLVFRLEDGNSLHVLLPADAIPGEALRQLRVRLRIEAEALARGRGAT